MTARRAAIAGWWEMLERVVPRSEISEGMQEADVGGEKARAEIVVVEEALGGTDAPHEHQ